MQFNLWFLFFGLLTVPFLPFCPIGFSWLFSWFGKFESGLLSDAEPVATTTANAETFGIVTPINDFALSVSKRLPSVIGLVLCTIWLLGVFVMLFFLLKSSVRLHLGYAETQSGTYFFAVNIQSDDNANGTNAAKITASVLSHMGIIPSDMILFQIPFTQAPHPISS